MILATRGHGDRTALSQSMSRESYKRLFADLLMGASQSRHRLASVMRIAGNCGVQTTPRKESQHEE